MIMGGKRFGAGILGGLLLGLLIVGGSSGFATGLYGSFTAPGVQNAVSSMSSASQNSSSSAMTSSLTSSSSILYTMSSSTGTLSPNSSSNGSASSTVTSKSTLSSVSSSATQATTGQTSSENPAPWYSFNFASVSGSGAANAGSSQAAPSRLSAIASQPAAQDGLVLLPVLVAVFLGAILYRASSGKKETPGAELKEN